MADLFGGKEYWGDEPGEEELVRARNLLQIREQILEQSRWVSLRDKTAWQWLELVLVPLFLAVLAGVIEVGAQLREGAREEALQRREDDREDALQERQDDQNRQEALIEYLGSMAELMTDKYLTVDDDQADELLNPLQQETRRAAQLAARGLTRATVTKLNGVRNGQIVTFLAQPSLEGIYRSDVLVGIALENADLRLAFLGRANLNGANLNGANLNGANLNGANLNGANLNGANLNGTDLSAASLIGSSFTDVNLRNAILSDVNLRNASLIGSDLFGIDLRNASLIGADLSAVSLIFADLREADLRGADLRGASLIGTNLIGVNLIGTNLTGANLSGANLQNILYNSSTTWPEDYLPPPSRDGFILSTP